MIEMLVRLIPKRYVSKFYPLNVKEVRSIFLKLLLSEKRKFNIGSGKFEYKDGWLYTDIASLDITKAEEWKRYLKFLKLDNIVSEHVWEHLPEKETAEATRNCYTFLKRGGNLRIAVPDGFHPEKDYIDWVKVGGLGPGADDHQVLY